MTEIHSPNDCIIPATGLAFGPVGARVAEPPKRNGAEINAANNIDETAINIFLNLGEMRDSTGVMTIFLAGIAAITLAEKLAEGCSSSKSPICSCKIVRSSISSAKAGSADNKDSICKRSSSLQSPSRYFHHVFSSNCFIANLLLLL